MAKISVLMAVYNGEKYLGQSINSILNQTWKDFEFVIIDDGSTDNSLKIINSYRDSRIRIISSEKNYGVAHARNIGLEQCTSEYIAIMDADDVAVPERLEVSYRFLQENNDIDGIYGKILHLNLDGRLSESTYPMVCSDYKYIKAYMILNNTIANPTAMFRRQIAEEYHIRYDETWKIASDYKFWCDYLKYGKIVGMNKVLCHYRIRKHSLYNNAPASCQIEAERKIKLYNFKQCGFHFSENESELLFKVFGGVGDVTSVEEMTLLYMALRKMVKQAKQNKLEYAEEVMNMCKNRFLEKIQRADALWNIEE